MEGWIKIHRGLSDNWLWKDKEPFDRRSAWIDLLLMANHKDFKTRRNNHIVMRKRGEVNTSVLYLSERWGWSRNKVYRFLELLKEDGMIHTDGTTDGTTVTIENYEKYQFVPTTDETTDGTPHGTPDGTTDGTHDKNVKEHIKKGKEYIYRDLPAELQDALKEFEQMRKSIKKPMTDKARKLLLNNLTKLAGDDTKKKVAILEQSILNCWQGVYELKEQRNDNDTTRNNRQRGRVAGGISGSEGQVQRFEDGTSIKSFKRAAGYDEMAQKDD